MREKEDLVDVKMPPEDEDEELQSLTALQDIGGYGSEEKGSSGPWIRGKRPSLTIELGGPFARHYRSSTGSDHGRRPISVLDSGFTDHATSIFGYRRNRTKQRAV